MKNEDFKNYLELLENLGTLQYRLLKERINEIESRKFVSAKLESEYNEIECPDCQSKQILRWGKRNDLQRFRCKRCKRTFNSLSGTPLAHLHKKGRWLNYSRCIRDAKSVRISAKECGVHRNTAFRWRHRFLKNTTGIKPKLLSGIIEVNEELFKISYKGSKKKIARKINKSVSVLFSKDRSGDVFDEILGKLTVNSLKSKFYNLIGNDSILFCKENKVLKDFLKSNSQVYCVDNKDDNILISNIIHTRNEQKYYNLFREWLTRFRGVATKYLKNYLSWYRGLDEFNMKIKPETIMLRAKSGGQYISNQFR